MKLIPMVKGYKATDKEMKCRGFQFELGKDFVHNGELSMCNSGFHFCLYPSGVWCYYDEPNTRVFEVEAYDVLNERSGDGAEVKMVAKRIKLIREIKIGGDGNTGDWNTGYRNTGDWNITNFSSGFFCLEEPKLISFDKPIKIKRDSFINRSDVQTLGKALTENTPIDWEKVKTVPNITKAKLKKLHDKFIEARKLQILGGSNE